MIVYVKEVITEMIWDLIERMVLYIILEEPCH